MIAGPAYLLQHIRRLVTPASPHAASDAALLGRFIRHRDEDAFAALVARHGGMVLGVCRRLLGDAHVADDAFQAVFLVLARRAASVRPRHALAAWLHGVARRVALGARAAGSRRARRTRPLTADPPAPGRDPLDELTARELVIVLHDEVQRLPAVYRLPVILCGLEGKSQEEAARLLGWTSGSVKGRLERGRRRLHARLSRRGLTLAAALAAVEASRGAAGTRLSAVLVTATARAALLFAAGRRAVGGTALGRAASLAEAALGRMAWSKGVTFVGLLTAALAIVGAGVLARQALTGKPSAAEDQGAPPPGQLEEPARPGAAPPPPLRADAHGDALPEGAIARLGTLRFRGVRGCLAFAPDGKLLAAATGPAGERVTFWEPATGQEVHQVPGTATLTGLAFSPDGRLLACSTNSARCRVLDVAGGQELFIAAGSHGAFSGDGKTLVTADTFGAAAQVHAWDTATGRLLRQWPAGSGVQELALAADGRTLALIDQADQDRVQLRDPGTGAALRSIGLGPRAGPGRFLAFSPDGKALASADGTGVRLWDTATGKELRGWGRRADGRPAFSADGKRLAWTGYDEQAGIARLWVVDRDGAAPQAVGTPVNNFEPPCFSADGKVLAVVTDAGAVQLRDVAAGKEVVPLDAHDSPVLGVALTADGRHVVSRTRTGIFAWEARTGRLLRRSAGFEGRERLEALLPDGRLLTADPTADPRQGLFRVREGLAGRELQRIEGRPDVGPPVVALAPGGRYAALHDRDGALCVFDLEAGRCAYRHDPKAATPGLQLSADSDGLVWYERAAGRLDIHVRRQATGKTIVLRGPAEDDEVGRWFMYTPYVSPDGRWLAVPTTDGRLRRWDLSAGKEVSPLAEVQRTVWHLFWSRDGRLVGARGSASPPTEIDPEARQDLRVWDVGTGKRLHHLELPVSPDCLLFAPDGRTLLTTDLEGAIHLWEVETGVERHRLRGHLPGEVGALALGADGRVLISGGYDSQVLVWDLTGRAPDGQWHPARQRPEELRAAWDALARADGPAAYTALWQLAADPEGATALLRDRLRPVPRTEPGRLARLIAALDAEEFAERQRAGGELEALGEAAASDLRRALARGPSAEARRRLEALLQALDRPPAGERLQALRGVEVLEQIGSLEARALLAALAEGEPEARLTREAAAALGRLSRRPAATP
jgi:RNA polymerase sigma factor (sigma-70 family)